MTGSASGLLTASFFPCRTALGVGLGGVEVIWASFWPVAYFGFFIVAVVGMVFSIVYGFIMVTEIVPNRRHLANLFPYLTGAISGMLTIKGRRARDRFVISLLAVAVAVVGALLTQPA